MPTPLQTPHLLPDLRGRRFASTQMGSKAIDSVREEFEHLCKVAALLIGVPPDELTREHLVGAEAKVLECRLLLTKDADAYKERRKAAFSGGQSEKDPAEACSVVIAAALGPLPVPPK